MVGLQGLLLNFQLAVDHFHLLVKSFERIDPMLELVDFCLEQLDFLILRIGGGCRLRVRRPGGEDRPDNYRRQQDRQNRQSEIFSSRKPLIVLGNFRMSGQLAVGN